MANQRKNNKKLKGSILDDDGNKTSERTRKTEHEKSIEILKNHKREYNRHKHKLIQISRNTWVERRVRDKRPINDELLKKIFDPFFEPGQKHRYS